MYEKIINLLGGISLEKLSGESYLVRGHVDNGKYGDPWEWVQTLSINGTAVEIKGLCVSCGAKFTMQDHINLAEHLRSKGIERGLYERIKNGKIYRYELK